MATERKKNKARKNTFIDSNLQKTEKAGMAARKIDSQGDA